MKKTLLVFLALLSLTGLWGCMGAEPYPAVTEGEFPFYVEFTMNDKKYIYEDTVVCEFDGYDHSGVIRLGRMWSDGLKNGIEEAFLPTMSVIISSESNVVSPFDAARKNDSAVLNLRFGCAEYYMGESIYPNFARAGFEFRETIRNEDGADDIRITYLTDKQLRELFGIEVIKAEFSRPIENKFEYTEEYPQISIFSPTSPEDYWWNKLD